MKVTELKALARERGLRGYSRLRRAELVALLQNNPPQMSTWEPVEDRLKPDRPTVEAPLVLAPRSMVGSLQRLRQPPHSGGLWPTQQEMDIFEQQEMSKSCPQVKNKVNNLYDWLVNHVPKTVKDKASRVFKAFKDKIMGLYNGITVSTDNQAPEVQQSTEPEPIELEQAFNEAYRSYRINGSPSWM